MKNNYMELYINSEEHLRDVELQKKIIKKRVVKNNPYAKISIIKKIRKAIKLIDKNKKS